jgi:hypothetical protein
MRIDLILILYIYRRELKLDAISPFAVEENPPKNPSSKRLHLGVPLAVILL